MTLSTLIKIIICGIILFIAVIAIHEIWKSPVQNETAINPVAEKQPVIEMTLKTSSFASGNVFYFHDKERGVDCYAISNGISCFRNDMIGD